MVLSEAKYGKDRFIEVEGYNIHYVEVGTGHAVILVPGSFSTYRAWNRVIPLFSDHYRLLALDYVGTGDSDKPKKGFRYTVEEQADLTAKMIEKLELGKVHLIGGSYGGEIVLNVVVRYPDLANKVVSIEGGVVRPEELPGDPEEMAMEHEGRMGVYFDSGGNRLLGTLFLARGDDPKPTAILLHGCPGIEKNEDLPGLRGYILDWLDRLDLS